MACKSIMYHYVRPTDTTQPHLFYLNIEDFQRQLDFFKTSFGFVTRNQWNDALRNNEQLPDGVVLTFDDGLIDHYRYVHPILKERGLWGVFYVSSATIRTRQLLNVHRVHYLLGRFGGSAVLRVLEAVVSDEHFIDGFYEQLRTIPYANQTMDEHSLRVKKIVNYSLQPQHKDSVLSEVFLQLAGDESLISKQFYMNESQMLEMSRAGLTFGAHGETHNLLTKFQDSDLKREVSGSIKSINEILDEQSETFCYPYGGSDSWNSQILNELRQQEIRYGFCVESTDIKQSDLRDRPLTLPRYDCNEFPHGQSRTLR